MTELEKIAEGREAAIFAWQDGSVLRLMRSPDARQAVEWQAIAMKAAREAGGLTTIIGAVREPAL